MTKELEKVCEEKAWEYFNREWEFAEDSCHRVDFKQGYKAAIQSEQVQGLIKALEQIEISDECAQYVAKDALEKFRGGE